MTFANSHTHYGPVTKSLHWLTALLIFTLIPLGFLATQQAEALQAGQPSLDISQITFLFSLHKTLGVASFLVAVARILWALSQPRPKLLHGDRTLEAWAAETVHWMLYGSLVAVPLTGWIHHAASTGFAPIWGPFGQSLPFVPQSETLSEVFSLLHLVSVFTLIASLGLHIAGAVKHAVIDRDDTLKRMLPGGRHAAVPSVRQPRHTPSVAAALLAFVGIWLGAFTYGAEPNQVAPQTEHVAAPGNWLVESGDLRLNITQLGNPVSGSFSQWQAQINYDPALPGPSKGNVEVEIAIASLQLGSITAQAMGPDYFDQERFATARFQADLQEVEGQFTAFGTLTIKEHVLPLSFPVDLTITEDLAEAKAGFDLDRRDFGIGANVSDAGTLGFAVALEFELTARRQ